jgi:hypothetical protein
MTAATVTHYRVRMALARLGLALSTRIGNLAPDIGAGLYRRVVANIPVGHVQIGAERRTIHTRDLVAKYGERG